MGDFVRNELLSTLDQYSTNEPITATWDRINQEVIFRYSLYFVPLFQFSVYL